MFRYEHLRKEVTIALVGKYTKLEDAYISVNKALEHAALACNRKLHMKVRNVSYRACMMEEVKCDSCRFEFILTLP